MNKKSILKNKKKIAFIVLGSIVTTTTIAIAIFVPLSKNKNKTTINVSKDEGNDKVKPIVDLKPIDNNDQNNKDNNKVDPKPIDNNDQNNEDNNKVDPKPIDNNDQNNEDSSNDSFEKLDNTIYIEDKNGIQNFETLEQAIKKAVENDIININKELIELDETIIINKNLTFKTNKNLTFKFNSKFEEGFKMLELEENSSLTLITKKTDDFIVFDGENKFLQDNPLIHVLKNAKLSATNAKFLNANNNNNKFNTKFATFWNKGHIILNNAEISGAKSYVSAAFRNEKDSIFEMNSGKILNNTGHHYVLSYSKGKTILSNSIIENNNAQWEIFFVADQKSSLEIQNVKFKNNSFYNSDVIIWIHEGSQLILGSQIDFKNLPRAIVLGKKNASVKILDKLEKYGKNDKLFIFSAEHAKNNNFKILEFANEQALESLENIYVQKDYKRKTDNRDIDDFIVIQNSHENKLIWNAFGDSEIYDIYNQLSFPFKDDLGTEFDDSLVEEAKQQEIKNKINEFYKDYSNERIAKKLNKLLENIKLQKEKFEKNKNNITSQINTSPNLKSANSNRERTNQDFRYENAEILGYYLVPGIINKFNVYLEGEIDNKNNFIRIGARPVNNVKDNKWQNVLLNKWNLERKLNKFEVDMTNEPYAKMLFLINDGNRSVKIRVEPSNDEPTIQKHPYFIYKHDQNDNGERFWNYINELKEYNKTVNSYDKPNMTILEFQFEEQGNFQISIGSRELEEAYKQLTDKPLFESKENAINFIENYATKLENLFKWIRKFDGYEAKDLNEANHITPSKVHMYFTSTIIKPSTFFAIGEYFHLPTSYSRDFLIGRQMHGWGFLHELGHTTDNRNIMYPDSTNNLFGMEAARKDFENYVKQNPNSKITLDSELRFYHEAIPRIEKKFNEKLMNKINKKENNDFFLSEKFWPPIYSWYISFTFLKNFDLKDSNSKYKEDIKKYGLWGAMQRIIREKDDDFNKVMEIIPNEQQANMDRKKIINSWRIVALLSIVSGYDFSDILQRYGQNDIPEIVKSFTSQFPKFSLPIEYITLNTFTFKAQNFPLYSDKTELNITFEQENSKWKVVTDIPEKDSTIGYELYKNDKLVYFTRSKDILMENMDYNSSYYIISYDYKLNKKQSKTFVFDQSENKWKTI
ncbi:hypothetical protein [Mesomycoplasma neurolyticum]|uniref:Peptidase M60 domain-containing protein n=1 Tax=Mesomycoplasma neurolyticum TaxID=2120 RepID=A0A449A4V1_9BACT|nr:hypothetical protein [Mesomycoplasma neurolyticum]VEU59268.1 Uncharacterised protein [Mesomycoplasma neurolyticum]